MKKIILVALVALAGFNFSFAQSEVADFLKAGTDDANKLIQGYIDPYAKAFGVGLNNSWYNTAATHKLWGFDLAFTVSAVKISGSDKTFDVNALGMTNAKVSGVNAIAPTVAGKGDGVELDIYGDPNNSSTFITTLKTPSGSGVGFLPIPMVQLTFGLLPHTDVIGRWVPTVKFDVDQDRAQLGLWGLGIKHNFKESLPFIRHLPFDASFFMGYSKINGESGVNFGFDNYGEPIPAGYIPDENQKAETSTSTFKYGLIASKKLSVVTFYMSLSGNSSKTNFDLLGRYPIGSDVMGVTVYNDFVDPIKLETKNSYVAVDAGFRLKLAFFSFFGSVSKSDYVSYNGGISFGFR